VGRGGGVGGAGGGGAAEGRRAPVRMTGVPARPAAWGAASRCKNDRGARRACPVGCAASPCENNGGPHPACRRGGPCYARQSGRSCRSVPFTLRGDTLARRPPRPGVTRRRSPVRRRGPTDTTNSPEVKEETIEMDATVVEPLPNAMFKVRLKTG